MGVSELIEDGKYLDAVEKEIFSKFIDALRNDNWAVVDKLIELLTGLSII